MEPTGSTAGERETNRRYIEEYLAGVAVTTHSHHHEVTVHAGAHGVVTGIELSDWALLLPPDDLSRMLTYAVRRAMNRSLRVELDAALALNQDPAAADGLELPLLPRVVLVSPEEAEAIEARAEQDRIEVEAWELATTAPPATVQSPGGEVSVSVAMNGILMKITVNRAGQDLSAPRLAELALETLRQAVSWSRIVLAGEIEQATARVEAADAAARTEEENERRFRESDS